MPEESKNKKTRNRSAAYPGVSLEEAVEATARLRKNLGAGPYSRESAAVALGYSGVSGASSAKVAACVHFGLLVRVGNVYKQSDLAQKLFVFVSEEEKQEALRIAVRQPALYGKIIDAHNGGALPAMLPNILSRNYSITERVASDAAANFIKSAEYAGILRNGVIDANLPDQAQTISTSAQADTVSGKDEDVQDTDQSNVDMVATKYFPVEIPDTGIRVLFPAQYTFGLSTGVFKTGMEELAKNAMSTVGTGDAK